MGKTKKQTPPETPLPPLPEMRADDSIPTGKLVVFGENGLPDWKATRRQLNRWYKREIDAGKMGEAVAALSAGPTLRSMQQTWRRLLKEAEARHGG